MQLVDMTRQQWWFTLIQVDVKQASTLGLTKIQVGIQDQMWRRDIKVVDNLQSKRDLGTPAKKGIGLTAFSENRFKEVTLDRIECFARQDVRGCE